MSDPLPYHDKETPSGMDDSYSLLVGPDGFECFLGEPEDRVWWRDGESAVIRLNEQHATIAALTAQVAALRACLIDVRHTLGNADMNSSLSVLDRLQGDLDLEAATQQVIEVCDTIDHALSHPPAGEGK